MDIKYRHYFRFLVKEMNVPAIKRWNNIDEYGRMRLGGQYFLRKF
jgi:hypothetical protein